MLNAWVLADTVCWMIIVVVRWSLKNIFIRVVMPNDTIMPDLLPHPCSHFYFDIHFGDRLYSKEKRPGSPLLF